MIEVKGLTKTFGENRAVDGVDMTVARGEVVGFLGPNGAGKSTTMKMISGFLEPDEGSAAVCGHDVQMNPIEAKRNVGYLPEGAPAYSDMVVTDFLEFVGKLRGLRGGGLKDRLADMAEQINLTEVWDQQIENLSKGYKRRVGIAQALIHDPDVLILDEPTDGLDPNQKHEMRSLIRSIAADKAIIVSTHILEEVEAVCSRAIIIAEGKVLADEAPEDLTAKMTVPNTIRVAVTSSSAEEAVSQVAAHAGKAEVEVLERLNGSTALLVKPNGRTTQPGQLASKLQRAKVEVEEIGLYRPSLEDVFRQITRPEGPR
ncbi:MAG: ATP-binding cassette domain-containing protein [Pseudomonadota bacterium]